MTGQHSSALHSKLKRQYILNVSTPGPNSTPIACLNLKKKKNALKYMNNVNGSYKVIRMMYYQVINMLLG